MCRPAKGRPTHARARVNLEAGDGVEAGGRRGEVAGGDVAGESVFDGGEHVAPEAGQQPSDLRCAPGRFA
jgi:hypothetical protein